MKLLLDMYRSAPKEQRDKVQLMAAEKKAKAEVSVISLFSLVCYLKNIFGYSAPELCSFCLQNWRLFLFSFLSLRRDWNSLEMDREVIESS